MKSMDKKPVARPQIICAGLSCIARSQAWHVQHKQIGQTLRNNTIQAKLTIGQPNDKYEQVTDSVTDQMIAKPDPRLQRQPENEKKQETVQSKLLTNHITPLVQRQEEIPQQEEDEALQAKSKVDKAPEVTPTMSSGIQSLQGGGQPLSRSERNFFEPRFGTDFSKVRVHNHTQSVSMACSVNALAFTLGNDVVFGAGAYSPNTLAGRKLLAHELTHVVQQGGVNKKGFIQRKETKADQAKRLNEVNDAALATAKTETKVATAEPHWAKTISAADLSKVSKVINYLKGAITDLKAGAKNTDAAMGKLYNAINKFRETKTEARRARVKGYSETGAIVHYFYNAKKMVDEATALLKDSKLKGISGLDQWIKKVSAMSAKMDAAQTAFLSTKKIDLTKLAELRDAIKKIRSDFMNVNYKFKNSPVAAEKIEFVLRYFLALNKAGYTKGPSLAEAAAIGARLGSVAADMAIVFGGDASDYALFDNFEKQLQKQIRVRSQMKAALGTEPGLTPGKSDVIKWFKSLKIASNADVIDAYRNFAGGFLIHRHEADPAVVAAKQTLHSIFARPTTISGARLAVCSGFAVLGKELLVLTGANFKKYHIGVQASDYQVKCSLSYNDVHALAQLTRVDPKTKKLSNMYVSNDDIVATKANGIGPAAPVWEDKTTPIYEGGGNTLKTATNNAVKNLAAKRKTLGNISCP